MTTESKPRILLVDDDPGLLRLLTIRLTAAGYDILAVENGNRALSLLNDYQPNLIVTDLRMDGLDGIALFDLVHEQYPTLPVIILTAHGTIPDAVAATRRGIFGYLTKPFDSAELLETIGQAVSLGGNKWAQAEDAGWRSELISRSAAMESLLQQARMVAWSDTSVLIQSESGTGKELLARAIHKASRRSKRPFVPVNCAAIPEQLLESELFGHTKGAFTGALQNQTGLCQQADGGTLFLDEIGDMPLAFQAKLLRVLQEREVRPVGSPRSYSVDIRVISATNTDLEQAIAAGDFREDLYYRLNVVMLELPRLAERREDIPLLANHFLSRFATAFDKRIKGFSPEAMEALVTAPWPGNVRQLSNVVEQSTVLCTSQVVPASLVHRALRSDPGQILSFNDARDAFERGYLVKLLQMTNGNVTQAARLAKRNRTEFYKLLRRHELEAAMFRADE